MIFRKLRSGLAEIENYFNPARAGDFLGNNKLHYLNDKLIIESGTLERRLVHNGEFVIEICKSYEPLNENDSAAFYIRWGEEKAGLIERYGNDTGFDWWRLIYYGGFLQAYKSSDGVVWENVSGVPIEGDISFQGFEIQGKEAFNLCDYKVYSSPYLKIYNCPKGYKAVLTNENENVVRTAFFDAEETAALFMDYCFNGRISIYDNEDSLFFESSNIPLKYGDEYFFAEHDVELIYRGETLDYKTNIFHTKKNVMTLKNNGEADIKGLTVIVRKPDINTDTVLLSLDGELYTDNVFIPVLNAGQSLDFYVRQERGDSRVRFGEFYIEIV